MNIQKSIPNSIDDVRTGIVTDPLELAYCKPHSHIFTLDPDGCGAEILIRHRDLGWRVWMTRAQAGRFADDLRDLLTETLPKLASVREEAVREGNGPMARLLAVVDLPPVSILEDPVYDAEEEALDFYRFGAWTDTITLVIGDNTTWGCERRMTEAEAYDFLDALDGNIAAWDEYL